MECAKLRVKDTNFERREILVRDGKGQKDRMTMVPERAIAPPRVHLERMRALHQADLAR